MGYRLERLLSLVVIRTVHLSSWTSIEYATAGSIPAIVPFALPSGVGTPCHFQPQKKGYPSHAFGEEYPCWWDTIRSVGYCSGIMSVNERTDIDYKRAEQVTDSERGIGEALANARGGKSNGSE